MSPQVGSAGDDRVIEASPHSMRGREECLTASVPDSNGSTCISTANRCTVEHETIERCEKANSGYTYLRTYQCTKAKDGRLFYQRTSSSQCYDGYGEKLFILTSSEKCYGGYGTCSEDGECLPARHCDRKDFKSECQNGAAVTCVQDKIRYRHCEMLTAFPICAVVKDNASCYSESDRCQTEGEEIVTRCNASTGKETLKKCTKSSEGDLFYVSAGSRACPNGCTPDGTKYAE